MNPPLARGLLRLWWMLTVLDDLQVDLLPHRQWAVSKWFYANPLWYYHRAGTDEQVVLNRRFYQLVDPDLRELCGLLNAQGLHTTPSCQGHFYLRDRFERIWEELRREAAAITAEGLVVKDSETQTPFLFRRGDYALPWNDFEAFHAQANEHQGTGYLGILLPPERQSVQARLCEAVGESRTFHMEADSQAGARLGGMLLHIFVKAPDPEVRRAAWAEVTGRVAAALNGV